MPQFKNTNVTKMLPHEKEALDKDAWNELLTKERPNEKRKKNNIKAIESVHDVNKHKQIKRAETIREQEEYELNKKQ